MTHDKHKRKLLIYGVLTLLIMGVIFLLSAQSGQESGKLSDSVFYGVLGRTLGRFVPPLTGDGPREDIRKIAHMLEFGCLGLSAFLFLSEENRGKKPQLLHSYLPAAVFSSAYACGDEWHQTFVPGRAGSLSDVLIDATGIFAALALAGILSEIRRWRAKKHKLQTAHKLFHE